MKKLYDITARIRELPLNLFDYPCVDPNSLFLIGKKLYITGDGTVLAQRIAESCKVKGVEINTAFNKESDVLIINSPSIAQKENTNEEAYFDVLFHYIRPVRKVLPYMLNKNRGNIIFILQAKALASSIEYLGIATFAAAALVKGLAQEYAGKGIVINGIAIDEKTDCDIAAKWVVFLVSGNARNIIGEVIDLSPILNTHSWGWKCAQG
jgi:hypothetical protein